MKGEYLLKFVLGLWLETKLGFTTKLGLINTNEMQDLIMICNTSQDDLEMNEKLNRKLREYKGALGNL
jgi:hypothetical protein